MPSWQIANSINEALKDERFKALKPLPESNELGSDAHRKPLIAVNDNLPESKDFDLPGRLDEFCSFLGDSCLLIKLFKAAFSQVRCCF